MTTTERPPRSVSRPRQAPELPTLAELGSELLTTTRWQRRWALARPFLLVLCFAAVWQTQLWWLTPLVMFLLFVAIVTVTHDVVHGALGLTPRQTEWWLFLLGIVLLESGHAYRATHHQHHRVFPGPDDPEGDPARMNFWTAVLWGPLFLPRLWLWSFRRNHGRADQQRWLLAEAVWAIGFPLVAMALIPISKGPMVYAAMAIVGSWVFRPFGRRLRSQRTHRLRPPIRPGSGPAAELGRSASKRLCTSPNTAVAAATLNMLRHVA